MMLIIIYLGTAILAATICALAVVLYNLVNGALG